MNPAAQLCRGFLIAFVLAFLPVGPAAACWECSTGC